MGDEQDVPLDSIDVGTQARKKFDEGELRLLGENIRAIGLLLPLLLTASGERYGLVAGERRLRAMRLVGLTSCRARILSGVDAADAEVIAYSENDFRDALRPFERARAMLDMKRAKGWTNKQLCECVSIRPPDATRYLAVFETVPEVQRAAEDEKIGPNAWYSISQASPADQPGLLALHLSGATASVIAERSRTLRKPVRADQSVRVSKIPIRLPGGISVVLSGSEMTLDGAIEGLADALKAARKAREEGLTAKSFAASMADKARKV